MGLVTSVTAPAIAQGAMEKVIFKYVYMRGFIKVLLGAIIGLFFCNVMQAQSINQSYDDDTVWGFDDTETLLTHEEMVDLWKSMKKVDLEMRNGLTENLTTEQVLQMKNWLKKGKTSKVVGRWMMIASPIWGVGMGAYGRAHNPDGKIYNGVRETPEWAVNSGLIGCFSLLVGGAILNIRGKKRYKTSQSLVVENLIPQYHDGIYLVSTDVRVIGNPYTHQSYYSPGITITF